MAINNRKAIINKALNIVLNILIVIFGLVLLVSIYTGIQTKILGHKFANFFGYTMFEVQTNSMANEIKAGDWILVKLTNEINLNDIITYELKGEYITHRVVEIHQGTYITKGDANNGKDEPVDKSQIVGKTTKVLSNFGIIRKILLNPGVLIFFIVTLFLFNSTMKKDTNNPKINKILSKLEPFVTKIKDKLNTIKLNEKQPKETKVKEILEEKNIFVEEIKAPENIVIEQIEEPRDLNSPILDKIGPRALMLGDEEIEILDVPNVDLICESEVTSAEDEPWVDDELDKTTFFRMVSVDLDELDETNLEIARNEMLEENKNNKEEVEVAVEEPEVTETNEDEGLTSVNLELIKENCKKNKNIIDAMTNLKKDELSEIASVFDEKLQANEATIKNTLISTYVNAKYYNYYNDEDIEYGRSAIKRIEKIIKIVAAEMLESYRGSDNKYEEKVTLYSNIFKIITSLDQAKENISEVKIKREFYREQIKNYYDWSNEQIESGVKKILEIQKTYSDLIKYLIKTLETNMFYLDYKKITSKKDLYAVNLEHNIAFSKVYSEYIINKTYTEGIIAEDKTSVLFTLLSKTIIEDMLNSDFNKQYIIHIPTSLYRKEKKLLRLLKMLDNEYAKHHIKILVAFEDLIKYNKNLIKRLRQTGFKFALTFTSTSGLKSDKRSKLCIVETIFLNKKDANFDSIASYIPGELLDNVIYDDIISKINDIDVERDES